MKDKLLLIGTLSLSLGLLIGISIKNDNRKKIISLLRLNHIINNDNVYEHEYKYENEFDDYSDINNRISNIKTNDVSKSIIEICLSDLGTVIIIIIIIVIYV